jgi:L-seryl-tRNA(Ser) seleniumtransferase
VTLLKKIPKVDKILAWPEVRALSEQHPRPVLVTAVRAVLAELRAEVLGGSADANAFTEQGVVERLVRELGTVSALSLKRVVNGTGVVIHTNLGRSPLPETVRQMLCEVAFSYSNLEFDLARGVRGSRYAHVEQLLCDLTGAEAALVVNNNAAAVLLALSSLAAGREVVVSRGELVEIGDSFRIPDVMRQGGALLREVGATNRTHADDYRRAVTTATGLLLKVHTSNFVVVGFTSEVSVRELAAIGGEFSLPVMVDAGSGSMIPLRELPGFDEPTVREIVRDGADVTTFSGDKLLGGPQAGIIVGKKELLDPMKKHPLLRAVRIDKMTLAALEGTLRLYRDERQALAAIPTLRMLTAGPGDLRARGRRLLRHLRRHMPAGVSLSLTEGHSQAGGGSLPLLELPTTLLAVSCAGLSPHQIESRLRSCTVPVIGRICKERFLLDLRTLQDDDFSPLVAALAALKS